MKQPQPAKVDKAEVQRLIELAEQGGVLPANVRELLTAV